MNDLIAKQELPATAKILTITTPRTSCIYFYLKSTNLTTQVDPSFLPAVVPLNLLPAHIEAMLAVMNTTELADRIRPEKNSGPYRI